MEVPVEPLEELGADDEDPVGVMETEFEGVEEAEAEAVFEEEAVGAGPDDDEPMLVLRLPDGVGIEEGTLEAVLEVEPFVPPELAAADDAGVEDTVTLLEDEYVGAEPDVEEAL